jgi:hypothetical protein
MTAVSTTFTPGPWAVNPVNAQVDAFDSGKPVPVCQLLWPTALRSEDVTEANGHLIAASPELYEMLRETVAWLEDNMCGGDLRERGRAALAKVQP